MEIELKKIECALILSGLRRILHRHKKRQEWLNNRVEEGKITDLTPRQIRKAKRNKIYKINRIEEMIEKFEAALDEIDVSVILSENDFDYPAHCTEFERT